MQQIIETKTMSVVRTLHITQVVFNLLEKGPLVVNAFGVERITNEEDSENPEGYVLAEQNKRIAYFTQAEIAALPGWGAFANRLKQAIITKFQQEDEITASLK